jgi:hypothetical protein
MVDVTRYPKLNIPPCIFHSDGELHFYRKIRNNSSQYEYYRSTGTSKHICVKEIDI